jgi:hypothetical protein
MRCVVRASLLFWLAVSPARAEPVFTGEGWSAKCTVNKKANSIVIYARFPYFATKSQIIRVSAWQIGLIAKQLEFSSVDVKKIQCSRNEFAGSTMYGECYILAQKSDNIVTSKKHDESIVEVDSLINPSNLIDMPILKRQCE